MKLINDKIAILIRQEIEWHKVNKGSSKLGFDYENGFIAGLKHILNLIRKINRNGRGTYGNN